MTVVFQPHSPQDIGKEEVFNKDGPDFSALKD
jgi:hypothetical protein